MRREIALLTLGASLGIIGLNDYGASHARLPSTMKNVLGVIAQKPTPTPTKPWYNCKTREDWTAEKQAWCQKAERQKINQ